MARDALYLLMELKITPIFNIIFAAPLVSTLVWFVTLVVYPHLRIALVFNFFKICHEPFMGMTQKSY